MAKDKMTGAERKQDRLEGTRPGAEPPEKDTKRETGKPESTAGEAPIDPADEAFIGKSKKE